FLAMTLVLGLAAGFGGLAFGLLDAFAAGAALGFLFRGPALFLLAPLGLRPRAGAGPAPLPRHRTQPAPGTAARGGRGGGGAPRGAAGAAGRPPGAGFAGAVLATGSGAGASPGAAASPGRRRLPRFSTTTCLLRP